LIGWAVGIAGSITIDGMHERWARWGTAFRLPSAHPTCLFGAALEWGVSAGFHESCGNGEEFSGLRV